MVAVPEISGRWRVPPVERAGHVSASGRAPTGAPTREVLRWAKYEPEARAELAISYLLHEWRTRTGPAVTPVSAEEFFSRTAATTDYGVEPGLVAHQSTHAWAGTVTKAGFTKFAWQPSHDDWLFVISGTTPMLLPSTSLAGRARDAGRRAVRPGGTAGGGCRRRPGADHTARTCAPGHHHAGHAHTRSTTWRSTGRPSPPLPRRPACPTRPPPSTTTRTPRGHRGRRGRMVVDLGTAHHVGHVELTWTAGRSPIAPSRRAPTAAPTDRR